MALDNRIDQPIAFGYRRHPAGKVNCCSCCVAALAPSDNSCKFGMVADILRKRSDGKPNSPC